MMTKMGLASTAPPQGRIAEAPVVPGDTSR
jgi:hypothetical protein